MRRRMLAAALVAFLAAAGVWLYSVVREREERARSFFPFYLPWNDASETVVSFSSYLHKPAGLYGYVYAGPDGHLYVGGQRIRFLGVNICARSAFPTRGEAEAIAARLAKFGVNIVRFHHMDAAWETFNIFQPPGTRRLNPAALERLDYFIAKLKENGIYVDLNLLVSRRLTAADGLPPEIEKVDWKDQQVLGFFVDGVKELHKEYARQLLLHKNPYTNMTYADDPAVAFVEIVNEQGLIHSWLDGVIDRLPDVFKAELQEKWNAWLREKYGSTEKLKEAWGGESHLGDEVLENPSFERGTYGWVFERHGGAQAVFSVDVFNGVRALKVQVSKSDGEGWHVQFNYPRLRVREGEVYLVRFRARAEKEATVTVCLRQAHDPWQALSQVVTVKLTPEWRTYEVVLGVSASDDNARLDISNLGALETIYYFADFSMRPYQGSGLREGESLERGTIPIFSPADFYGRPPSARRDWAEFLWELERAYFLDMYRFLKEELGVKALVIGTIAGCSTPVIMSQLDAVDTHAYWQHPAFPGTPWDPRNWYVVNEPMVNHPLDGTITWLASRRVLGKPFTVTEYNHPAPNMYDAEAFVILSAYAAMQDWDAIFAFAYDNVGDARRITGYFDISQSPQKMASLLLAHAIFVRGDVAPASNLVTIPINREVEIDLLVRGKLHAWDMPGAHHLGWDPATPLIYRFALEVNGSAKSGPAPSPGPAYRSDNGQVIWDCSESKNCVLVVNSQRTVAVVGFGVGRNFNFEDVSIELERALLNFSVVGLTSLDDKPLTESGRMLLVALGYTGNTGLELREYGTSRVVARVSQTPQGYAVDISQPLNVPVTCGDNWGSAPTIAEGIRAKIRVKGEVEVWALDNTGRRMERVPVSSEGGWSVFEIGPQYKTIWYEVSRH